MLSKPSSTKKGGFATWTFLVLQQRQNLGRRFGTSKMHLSPRWLKLLSVLWRWLCCCWLFVYCYSHVGVCNCSMFCCMILYVRSSIAIILMGKRELVALLNLSSWCLVMVEWLFLVVPWVVCGLWLWYFLIIFTYYFCMPVLVNFDMHMNAKRDQIIPCGSRVMKILLDANRRMDSHNKHSANPMVVQQVFRIVVMYCVLVL